MGGKPAAIGTNDGRSASRIAIPGNPDAAAQNEANSVRSRLWDTALRCRCRRGHASGNRRARRRLDRGRRRRGRGLDLRPRDEVEVLEFLEEPEHRPLRRAGVAPQLDPLLAEVDHRSLGRFGAPLDGAVGGRGQARWASRLAISATMRAWIWPDSPAAAGLAILIRDPRPGRPHPRHHRRSHASASRRASAASGRGVPPGSGRARRRRRGPSRSPGAARPSPANHGGDRSAHRLLRGPPAAAGAWWPGRPRVRRGVPPPSPAGRPHRRWRPAASARRPVPSRGETLAPTAPRRWRLAGPASPRADRPSGSTAASNAAARRPTSSWSSPAMTTPWPVSPCVVEFRRAASLPATDLGPVDRSELALVGGDLLERSHR